MKLTLVGVLLGLLIGIALQGCVTVTEKSPLRDGYQVGDVTRELIYLQDAFCNQNDVVAKMILLKALDDLGVEHDGQNVCEVDILELWSE